ncbi:spore germination protein [Bacillus sp. 31A1R]|uniref:Spore germination protein n=1 Tax=Robertmurraya mangrovi TaxID=3098077 RepID=A0ABU5ISN1_9BACI|nr:spore germination protein [Bacillus sp. 31A1R]MDZ5470160.1 spore germination protein [Bacillus sp. 31A1R]
MRQNFLGLADKILEQFSQADDLIHHDIKYNGETVTLYFLKSIANEDSITRLFIKPFFEVGNLNEYCSYIRSLTIFKEFKDEDEVLQALSIGHLLVKVHYQYFLFDTKNVKNNVILETAVETTVHGPHTAFSEDFETNLNMIRHRYHEPKLAIEIDKIGKRNDVNMVLIYDPTYVNPNTLDAIKTDLKNLDKSLIISVGQLQKYMNKKSKALLPTTLLTERPDRTIFAIEKGKVVVMIDGSPFVLIAPAIFYDFMSAMDDIYQFFWATMFIRLLRYGGLFLTLLLPGLYVAVTSYNTEVFRVQLALSIASSRVGVPYPSFIEVLFMLLMMEFLIEASLRLPKTISSTATMVGGLILGQAATEAVLISNIMIIIVAAVAIANFVIPINEMSVAIRVLKYVLLFTASIGGLMGLTLGFVMILFYFIQVDSYGEPYLKVMYEKKEKSVKGESA